MKLLVTGGAGYIGSHAVVALLNAGHDVTVLDNLSNSHPAVMDRVGRISGRQAAFVEGDVRDGELLDRLFARASFDAVMHFAGLKAVAESVAKPLDYYDDNLIGAITLLRAMQKAGVGVFVFSSSATVYGPQAMLPYVEDSPRSAVNPYGRTKLMIEDVLEDLENAEPEWRIARLRYFNPVGAHESGLIGENPRGTPNNLMPYIAQVALGKRERLSVFGGDYPTPDGTGVRDYIHVMDLAEGHVAALSYLEKHRGMLTLNLGTGRGYSVLEVVRAFEKACGRPVPYSIVGRREGDLPAYWADPSRAKALLGWHACRDLAAMCADTWRWQSNNPEGYS